MKQYHKTGFTLIELSIVLVTIGLIVGGILVGQDLIHVSRIRHMVSDIDNLKSATNTFQLKYEAMPGDYKKAESLWGSDLNCPNTPTNAVGKAATCNGNGDGIINAEGSADVYEVYRAIQQLADAGLVPGSYTGVAGPVSIVDSTPGINVMQSPFSNAGYIVDYNKIRPGDPTDTYPMDGTFINFASTNTSYRGLNFPVISGPEALSIDQKLDDGLPGTGSVLTWNPSWIPCATTADPATARYIASDDSIRCALKFLAE